MTKKRVVVTGIGVISSIGIGKDAFWDSLIKGKSGVSKITAYDTSEHATHNGGEVRGFDPESYINKRKIRFMGRTSQFAIAAAKLAISDAGAEIDMLKTSIAVGTTMGEACQLEKMDKLWLGSGDASIDKELFFQYLTNSISANLAIELGASGSNRIFGNACAAGNYAIGYGYDVVKNGKADVAIVGGADSFSRIAFTGFNQFAAVAPDKCQPFDKNRKGIIVGEGAGILILESLENAKKREADIYGEILGYGLSCDAYNMTNPQTDGIVKCMESALRDAGTDPDEIDYISTHGTGTILNDKAECAAIKRVFGDRYKKIPANSIKSMLGHTMAGASALEAISCCLTLKEGIIPPTINYEAPDPECDIDCVPNRAREHNVDIALNNSYAFGGNNACLVFKRVNKRR